MPGATEAQALEPLIAQSAGSRHGVTLAWKSVGLEVTCKTGLMPWSTRKLEILKDTSGVVRPGQLLAILGPSGSGKTSLLNSLADRHEGQLTGDITLNGTPRNARLTRKLMGYVMQDDSLLPHLTVYETLMNAARLRLPRSMSAADKHTRVESVIAELGLRPCRNTKIGDSVVRGVSGGQRRRVSIGIQLIIDPKVLLLDEPTSGLDSTTAHNLMETLSRLASNNRTIVATIHQPRSDIFAMLDLVLLLSAGRTVYFGKGSSVVPYFSSLGFNCPKFSNPADYILDVTSVDSRNTIIEVETQDRLLQFIEKFETSETAAQIQQTIRESAALPGASDAVAESKSKRISFFEQTAILMHRNMLGQMRSWQELLTRALAYIGMGLAMGGVFYKITNDKLGIHDRFGLTFFATTLLPFMVILSTVAKVDSERACYYRERRDNMYGPAAAFVSKTLAEIPFTAICSVLYVVCYYFLSYSWVSWERFAWYTLTLSLAIEVSVSLAVMLGNLITNFQTSVFVANLVYTLSFLSCGYIVSVPTIPVWFRWMKYISYIRFSYVGLVASQFQDREFEIDPNTVMTQDQIYSLYGIDHLQPWECVVRILAVLVVFRIVALAALYVVDQRPQR